ncbi:MAG: NAD kinase [Bacteroidota bacterium]
MRIAIFGRLTERTDLQVLVRFFAYLNENDISYLVHYRYAKELERVLPDWANRVAPHLLTERQQLRSCAFAYSFGGDGTFLNTAMFVKGIVPVLGVNFGRLGFLTTIMQDRLHDATEELRRDMYKVDLRTAIVVESNPQGLFGDYNLGLNDFTIHKTASNEMITVHTYINGEFLNSYWGDGLIVATATGSTAYSLSCGGPIIHPNADSLVITPVAPHSLTVRPIILPDNYVISFEIESRTGKAMVSLDTRTEEIENRMEIAVRKSEEKIKLVRVASANNYLDNLRSRLMWGRDSRN